MKQSISIFWMLFLTAISVFAQDDCPERLIKALSSYEQGNIDQTIQLASGCATSQNEEYGWQAYRLLAMAYLVNHEDDKAREAAENMLELYPLFQPDLLNDPQDFTNLLKQINVIPKFSLGLTFNYGANWTSTNIQGTFTPAAYKKEYKGKSGYQFGAVAGYNFSDRNSLQTSLFLKSRKYSMSYSVFGQDLNIDESLLSIDMPLMFRHTFFPKKRIQLSVSAGAFGSVLINAYNDLSIRNSEGVKEIKHYSTNVRRNSFHYGICTGSNISYKIKKGHLSLEVLYFKSLSNITYEKGRYDNTTLLYDFFYLDDNIYLDNLALSFGYHRYISYKIHK
ncbi:MAG: hypothetical protein ACI8ZN_002603 [Bacteroidia bacterium]|jgi:hypothetical protein